MDYVHKIRKLFLIIRIWNLIFIYLCKNDAMYRIPTQENGLLRAKKAYSIYQQKLEQFKSVEVAGEIINITPLMVKRVMEEVAEEMTWSLEHTRNTLYTVMNNMQILNYVD